MRRVSASELGTDFERTVAWGDDERHYYHPNRRKAAVMAYFLRLDEVLRLVRERAPGRRVADLASAQGNFGLLLAEAGFDVTALDLNEEFLRYARRKHTHGAFRCVQANLLEYRGEAPFDCVLMGEIIEHVAHPARLLNAAFENLAPGGLLVLTTPNGDSYANRLPTYREVAHDLERFIPQQFHWGDHLFLYTETELRELLAQAGFDPAATTVDKVNSAWITQIKGARYLLPRAALSWLERRTRGIRRQGRDSTENLIVTARRPRAAD